MNLKPAVIFRQSKAAGADPGGGQHHASHPRCQNSPCHLPPTCNQLPEIREILDLPFSTYRRHKTGITPDDHRRRELSGGETGSSGIVY
jgi:hypothetical protein